MGLDTSHGAWHGSYHNFYAWRGAVAGAAGYSDYNEVAGDIFDTLNAEEQPPERSIKWNEIDDQKLGGLWVEPPGDALVMLLAHSGCEGSIFPRDAEPIASRLEELLPAIRKVATGERDWLFDATEDFIDGLRAAAAVHEPVTFG